MTQWRWILLAASVALFAGCGGEDASQQTEPESTPAEKAEQADEVTRAEEAAPEQPATDRPGWGDNNGKVPKAGALIKSALKGGHRAKGHPARDKYRHPAKTLQFFGLEPDMTVIELYPGGSGWYTEVLAPVLHRHGKLIVASYPPDSEVEYFRKSAKAYEKKLADNPAVYGDVEIVHFQPPKVMDLGEAERADMVVTFRNLHNWHEQDALGDVFEEAFRVLKPGGVFGVVEHRAAEGKTIEDVNVDEMGYMPEDYVIELAEEKGFTLADTSDVNANPDDTADHPMGVWTLPPTLRYCKEMDDGEEKTECMKKYKAIGESDRMTLKFVKPATE
jgi:predicted methyltransferase